VSLDLSDAIRNHLLHGKKKATTTASLGKSRLMDAGNGQRAGWRRVLKGLKDGERAAVETRVQALMQAEVSG
jgi:ATP:corrinoid adenosyltransferase